MASVAVHRINAAAALQTFYSALEEFGLPARFLSVAVFCGTSRRSRVAPGHSFHRPPARTATTPTMRSRF